MAGKELLFDFSEYDLDHVVADLEEIRRYNRQRFEMEQLTAIVLEDDVKRGCVGYKDVTEEEFWVRGHLPGMPLMPGVIICEAAAQLSSYYATKNRLLGDQTLGFGGLSDVHFRGIVRPGDRLVVATCLKKHRPGVIVVCDFQVIVDQQLVCDGIIKGIPLPDEQPVDA